MIQEEPSTVSVVRIWFRQNVIVLVLSLFILLSLGLHAYTFLSLQRVRDVVRLQLDSAAQQVAEAKQQQVHFDFPIKQGFPFSTTVDLNETFEIPINESIVINETFQVPIDIGSIFPGVPSLSLPVPVNITVPISTTVRVPIRKQIPINTVIDVDTVVPFDIGLQQPPLGDLLSRIEATLRDLRTKL